MRKLVLASLVAVLSACPTPVIRPTPDGGFAIVPASASADPGQAIRFVLAAAQGAPPVVTWTVVGGGAVAADGTFTAPGCASTLPATITITASSGASTATATVSVDDKVTGVTISPPTVSLAPGASQKFTATVKTVCNPTGVATAMKATRAANGSVVVTQAR